MPSFPAADLVPIPQGVSDDAAAAVPLAALTAWQALIDRAKVEPGDRVLIHGAGGGVGHLAVQIAVHLGARVIAVAGADKHEWLRALGAEAAIDHRREDFVASLADDPVDVVLALLGDDVPLRSLQVLRRGGVLVTATGPLEGAEVVAAARADVRAEWVVVHADRDQLGHIARLLSDGTLTVEVARVFDVEEVREAHRALEAGHARGKSVLRLG